MPVFSILTFKESKFFVFPLTKYLQFIYSMIFPTFYLNKGLNDKVGMKLEIEGGKFVSKKTMAYVVPFEAL